MLAQRRQSHVAPPQQEAAAAVRELAHDLRLLLLPLLHLGMCLLQRRCCCRCRGQRAREQAPGGGSIQRQRQGQRLPRCLAAAASGLASHGWQLLGSDRQYRALKTCCKQGHLGCSGHGESMHGCSAASLGTQLCHGGLWLCHAVHVLPCSPSFASALCSSSFPGYQPPLSRRRYCRGTRRSNDAPWGPSQWAAAQLGPLDPFMGPASRQGAPPA